TGHADAHVQFWLPYCAGCDALWTSVRLHVFGERIVAKDGYRARPFCRDSWRCHSDLAVYRALCHGADDTVLISPRQHKRESGPGAEFAGKADGSSLAFDGVLYDSETQPGSPRVASARFFDAIKSLKHAHQISTGNSASGILNFQREAAVLRFA